MVDKADIVIVGAGIAGASLAAETAPGTKVVLIEAEDTPGYHTTGRSAAFWTESYGGPFVQPLTTASGRFLAEGGFLTPRVALTLGREGQQGLVEQFMARFAKLGVRVELLDRSDLESHISGIRDGWACGVLEPDCCDIDVAALHQAYLTRARKAGAEVLIRSRLEQATRDGNGWLLKLGDGRELRCDLLVDAAGAWADDVARLAGVSPMGIQPLRRTMVQARVSPQVPADLPLVLDISEKFYFKPESGGLWLSPHDETPSIPCDASAEELDVAIAIDRLEQVVDWRVTKVDRSWAGLRSFAPDRLPVYGFDPEQPGFFWFAGQGGFGIQTAPAAAKLAAGLIRREPGGEVDPGPFLPSRFQ